MGAHFELHTHESLKTPAGTRLRQGLAAGLVLFFAGLGVFVFARQRQRYGHEWTGSILVEILIVLGCTFLPAAWYGFGYFRRIPDALGGKTIALPIRQRWSDYARLAAAIAVLATCLAWTPIAMGREEPTWVFLCVPIFTSIMVALVAASEGYLVHTTLQVSSEREESARKFVQQCVGRWGGVVARILGAKRSLFSGAVLVLMTLFLATTTDSCLDKPHSGYEVLSGKSFWITAEVTLDKGRLQNVVARVGRVGYIVGLAIAILALAAAAAGRAGNSLRRSHILAVASGTLAVFAVTDNVFGWIRSIHIMPHWLNVILWTLAWILPVMLWRKRAHGPHKEWEHTRMAVMIFYVPFFFWFLALLPYTTDSATGYSFFLIGTLLLWWGFVQSAWEVTQRITEGVGSVLKPQA
ncbi:MAG: hypothetical protein LAO18_02870 [Acidobacteriia bacterium]|nr:hypothetical protein [Terriglobia bacterium]